MRSGVPGNAWASARMPSASWSGGSAPALSLMLWKPYWSIMRRANTFDAHRLLAWALRTEGAEAQRTLKKRILRAYFTEGADVSDHAVLAGLAEEAGLERVLAEEVLATDAEAATVREEEASAHREGIAAVPTFVVEGRWMLQGALETDKWVRALTRLQAELDQERAPS